MNYAYFAGLLESSIKDIPRRYTMRRKIFKNKTDEEIIEELIKRAVEHCTKKAKDKD